MASLALSGVNKHFGDHVAVHGFDLDVAEGEFVSFLGPSGCGKTTTLRMIAGFELPSGGTIHIAGEDVSQRPPNQRNVGMVFQTYALFPNMTVADNIGFGLRMRRTPRHEVRSRVAEMLELIHLPDAGRRYPYELSGGMQQRVALARALAIRPRVLLLDEPLSALDAKIRISLRAEIRSIQRQLGITTVYVTHDQEEALSLSDRVVVMSQGRIEQVGTPSQVYDRPANGFVARFVGTVNVLAAEVLDPAAGTVKIGPAIVRTGTSIGNSAPGAPLALALRPEAVAIGEGAGGVNRLGGQVDDLTFLGSIVRVRVRLHEDSGVVLVDQFNQPGDTLPAIGEPVMVTFAPEACVVVAPGDDHPRPPPANGPGDGNGASASSRSLGAT